MDPHRYVGREEVSVAAKALYDVLKSSRDGADFRMARGHFPEVILWDLCRQAVLGAVTTITGDPVMLQEQRSGE